MTDGRLVDLHAHVLPGVDDGPADVGEAVALARAMVAGGVGTVVATSHVSEKYRNDAASLAAARERLEEALRAEDVGLTVMPGAEVAIDQAAVLDDDALTALKLGGGPYLLVEPSLSPAAADLDKAIHAIMARGHQVVIAHPERIPAFQRDYDQLVGLVAEGALCAVTAAAFTGRFGRTARRTAREMLLDGMVHCVSSDAHDLASRKPALVADMEVAAEELRGLLDLVPWLLRDAPAAILRGERPSPPPADVEHVPAEEKRGGRLRRLLRRD